MKEEYLFNRQLKPAIMTSPGVPHHLKPAAAAAAAAEAKTAALRMERYFSNLLLYYLDPTKSE